MSQVTKRSVTVTLPENLIMFADRRAIDQGISRSQLIADLLAECKKQHEEILATEGFLFYAQEAVEFAQISQQVVLAAWDDIGSQF